MSANHEGIIRFDTTMQNHVVSILPIRLESSTTFRGKQQIHDVGTSRLANEFIGFDIKEPESTVSYTIVIKFCFNIIK